MNTTIITNPNALLDAFRRLMEWSTDVDLCIAWATSSNGQGRHWKELDLDKVQRAIVGTAFAQTEPDALLELNQKADRLRLMINSTGTFHPKVILGRRGSKMRAIVGSANFTAAAYTSNTELSVLLDGVSHDPAFKDIEGFIEVQWANGVELNDEWLAQYTLTWNEAKRKKIIVPGARLEVTSVTDLDMTWSKYFEVIKSQEGRQLTNGYRIRVTGGAPSYFEELRLAQAAFRREPRFKKLSKEERDLMMGVGRASSGLLGSMRPAREARGIVKRSPEVVGAVLDRLPLDAPVTLIQATKLLTALTEIKGIKLGVATRFFAVKRPDLFVSINNGSRPQLAALQCGREVRTLPQYIKLLADVWGTEWHQSKRPADKIEAIFWDRRAALLDAALYEQVIQPR